MIVSVPSLLLIKHIIYQMVENERKSAECLDYGIGDYGCWQSAHHRNRGTKFHPL